MEEIVNCKTNYFKYINEMKKQFEKHYQRTPTHLICGIDEYYDLENSDELLNRLIYIKDCTDGILGTTLLGMKVVKSLNFKGVRVALL